MSPSATAAAVDPHHARRWLILGVLGVVQLMLVLDATIINIALPSAQADLGFSTESRQWVITAYALAFGSLLLLGGRLGDLIGRKRLFVIGLLGFAGASALGGAAGSFGVLVVARALQGLVAALVAPAALSLVATTFTDPRERGTAFGVFAAISGIGAGVGLLLGGVLTQYLSWRWCLYVNLLFAVPAALGGLALLHGERAHRHGEQPRLDVPGALTVTAGLFALVFGFSNAESHGWGDAVTLAMLAASVVLLVLFAGLQQRVAQPLLPLRVLLERNRGGAYLALGIGAIAIFVVSLFLTYYMQQVLDFSPVQTGFAFMPMNVAIMTGVGGATALLQRIGPRVTLGAGLALTAVSMALFAQLEADSGYATGVLPGLIVMGIGFGLVYGGGMTTATLEVAHRDASVGSAMVNVSQQVGGSIGTALLSTIFASAVRDHIAANASAGVPNLELAATIHGYATAFWWTAAILAAGTIACGLLLRTRILAAPDPDAVPVIAH
ncbi:MFS transporter [Conexibacter sp. JD483]|uniref:MFS transporter n=1 Tax=unclassified Conexibacter TaxID=2627773 RepID=UPI0027159B0C|nr:MULTISPECIES: MFS transporter [unclassified Conexibacter]MDO8186437.1 MFS transporter [Conexibacter sp. CPCC 205706]MDO8200006.1 MFS transporter [Conexibacter sp. CPCC 205762]MDR9370559.1 MFS transporter [Conexibacter sp. JD483]